MKVKDDLINDFREFSINGIPCSMIFVEGGNYDRSLAEEIIQFNFSVEVASFFIAKFPVTQDLYKEIMGHMYQPQYFGGELPIGNISFNQIEQEFLPRLNDHPSIHNFFAKNRFKSKFSFRLPTELEWEYAATGGKYNEGYTHCGSDDLKQVGWYDENSESEIKPAGLLNPNELGLFDMSGNVWEWCSNEYDYSFKDLLDDKHALEHKPEPPDKVMRGGSSDANLNYCGPYGRRLNYKDYRFDFVGFRLVVDF